LWYANISYNLQLGQLVSVWTSYISNGDHGCLTSIHTPFVISIFPERDRTCYFMIHRHSDPGSQFRTPLGYSDGQPIPTLMTLRTFVNGGHEIVDCKIMVCIKSIGPTKTYTTKQGTANDCTHVRVFDDTGEAALSLWSVVGRSAAAWEISKTVLMLTNPSWKMDKKGWLSLNQSTMVDVDPDIPDACWLKGYAQRILKREHINPTFPEGG